MDVEKARQKYELMQFLNELQEKNIDRLDEKELRDLIEDIRKKGERWVEGMMK